MMKRIAVEHINTIPGSFRKFIRRNCYYYLIPNCILNTCIPYFSFENLQAVSLFQGAYPLARFILPMALFMPLLITFDISKKTIALAEKGKTGFTLPEHFSKKRFLWKSAMFNGLLTFFIILLMMGAMQFLLPAGYTFNGLVLSVCTGCLAGALAILFTLLPVHQLRKLASV